MNFKSILLNYVWLAMMPGIIIIFFGCSNRPEDATFYKFESDENVTRNELAGLWEISPRSVTLLKNFTTNKVSIVSLQLDINGKLNATNFPIDIGEFKSSLNLMSGVGSWNVERNHAAHQVDITLDAHGEYLDIRFFENQIILTITLDDPDSGKTLVFQRISKNK